MVHIMNFAKYKAQGSRKDKLGEDNHNTVDRRKCKDLCFDTPLQHFKVKILKLLGESKNTCFAGFRSAGDVSITKLYSRQQKPTEDSP